MKIFKIGLISVFILALLPIGFNSYDTVYAEEKQDTVRIGLESKYKSISTVSIKNPNLLLQTGNIRYPLSTGAPYQVVATSKTYLKSGESFNSYQGAKEKAETLPKTLNTRVGLSEQGYWVYSVGYTNEKEATIHKSEFPNAVVTAGTQVLEIQWSSGSMIVENTEGFKISDANNEPMDTGSGKYRGALSFALSGGKFTMVNVVPMEEYLYSVVPSEMPSSWSLEALKSQAVAARTYTLSRASANVHTKAGYDLCDTTHCQVYSGVTKEAASTTQAVKETKGMEAYYDNKPINAVFFSSSGGITDQSENAWGSPVPYLKSVVEINETTPKEWSRTFTLGEITTLAKNKGYKIGTITGVSIGKVENERVVELILHGTGGQKAIKGEEIRTFFSATSGGMLYSRYFRIGENVPMIVKTSQPKEFSVVEKPKESDNTTESKTETDSKDYFVYEKSQSQSIKPSFAYVYHDGDVEAVPASVSVIGKNSTATYVAAENKPAVQPAMEQKPVETRFQSASYVPSTVSTKVHTESSIVLNGKGWGHGVGMSQYGAKGMAEMGYTYKEILSYYYTGIEIK